MAEFIAGDNSEVEDWESECYDSGLVSTSSVECRPVNKHHETSGYKLPLEPLNGSCSYADVEPERLDVIERRTEKFTYVIDNKKLFVSNVNFRVSISAVVCGAC